MTVSNSKFFNSNSDCIVSHTGGTPTGEVREAIPMRRSSSRKSPAGPVVLVRREPIRTVPSKVSFNTNDEIKEFVVPTLVEGATQREHAKTHMRRVPLINNALSAKKGLSSRKGLLCKQGAFFIK